METFSHFSWYEWLLISIFLLAFAVQLFFYFRYYTTVFCRSRLVKKQKVQFTDQQPPVSVIICARNEAENLENFLPLVLEQDYPQFEVIVVNDGSVDDSDTVLTLLAQKYPNLYITQLPEAARIISRKKLGITIGIKASHYDTLLFIDADCRPLSPHWIAEMVRNFTPETEFVLGYGGYYREKSLVSRLISYDTLFIALQYFGFAFRGTPYMGVGRNLAYKKSLFYRLKGFAGTLHVPSGDDDLLVNEAATRENTRIETSLGSITLSVPKHTFGEWIRQKTRHVQAANLYTRASKFLLGIEPFSRAIFYLTLVALIIVLPLQSMLCVLSIFLVRYAIQLVIVNISAKKLNEKYFVFSLILFDILLPILTLYCMTLGKIFAKRKKNVWK